MQKNEIGPLSDAINKNKFKHKAWKCKAPRIKNNGIPSGALDNDFMGMTQKALATKTKINDWHYIKISFCKGKEKINRVKRQPMEWEIIFLKHVSEKS